MTPFACSLSPSIRAVTQLIPGARERMKEIAGRVAEQIDKNRPVAMSLRETALTPGAHYARQCDLTTEANGEGKVILKTFVRWHDETNCWLVMVESPDETYWEESFQVEATA